LFEDGLYLAPHEPHHHSWIDKTRF
jgi:hypothetical protein